MLPNLALDWVECGNNQWCSFMDVDLAADRFKELSGVYVIFYMEESRRVTVRLGQGKIADRITDHRNNEEILRYNDDDLLVTWAEAPAEQLDGIEKYLADALKPLVGERFPDRVPIPVNLPL